MSATTRSRCRRRRSSAFRWSASSTPTIRPKASTTSSPATTIRPRRSRCTRVPWPMRCSKASPPRSARSRPRPAGRTSSSRSAKTPDHLHRARREGLVQPLFRAARPAGRTAVPGRHTRGVAKMAAINASMVAELRAKTDAPMMECKRALTEADGDMARAEEILRVKLGSKAGKAASRITAEGVVAIAIDGPRGAIVEVNCETDFVSKNEAFVDFAQACADLVVKHDPADLAALAALPLAQGGFGPTVEDVRKGLIGKIGENMSLRRFERVEGASRLASYLHGRRIGVIVRYQGSDVAARDVAMHVAAMKPVALAAADVPAALIERERRIAAEKAAEDAAAAVAAGKPAPSAEIVARRVEGAVQKFLKESSLLDQAFVKNDKQSVAQMLAAAGTQVSGYTLYVVGEGMAKRSEDFAAEVAAQVAAARQP